MFGSLITAAIPLISAMFSVGAGLAAAGPAGLGGHLPDHRADHRHPARPGRGRGLRAVPGLPAPGATRRRDGCHHLGPARPRAPRARPSWWRAPPWSISILGLYVVGVSLRRARSGLAAALVVAVTMIAALTMVPALMGLVRGNVRSLPDRIRARREPASRSGSRPARPPGATEERHEHSAFARWGRMVCGHPWPWGLASVALLVVLAIPLFSITLGQPDNGTNPTSQSNRRAYDLIKQGFGVGVNGPLASSSRCRSSPARRPSRCCRACRRTCPPPAAWPRSARRPSTRPANTAVFNVIPTTRPQASATTSLVPRCATRCCPSRT